MGIGFVVLSCKEKQEQFKNRATLTSKYHFPGLQGWHSVNGKGILVQLSVTSRIYGRRDLEVARALAAN